MATVLVAALGATPWAADAQMRATAPPYSSLGNAGYQVKHYDIELSWSAVKDAHGRTAIEARTTVTAKATQKLTSFSLDLAGLTVESVSVAGHAATYSRYGNKLLVTPDSPVASGVTFKTVVEYAGKPRTLIDADGSKDGWINKDVGAIVLAEPRGSMTWFPNNNTPADKATFDFAVTVPTGYQAVSNGRNTSVVGNTWHWATNEPMATYLATVDIGKFTRHTSTVDGIRYDSFIANSVSSNTTALRQLPKIVAFEEKYFGRYPFADAGMIVDNPPVFYALEVQNRPFYPGLASTLLQVHELAHQWFGDSVSLRRWNHMWLNEGFATYAEWLWSAKHGGPSTRSAFRAEFRAMQRWRPAPMRVDEETLFSDAVYLRGAMTLQVLRERVGTKTFFRIVRHWTADHRHGNGTTTQFKRLAEKVSDKQLDKLFRDWLYVAKRPTGYVR